MKYLFIDFGSTWIKYAVFDSHRQTYCIKNSYPFPDRMQNIHPDIFEVSLTDIIRILEQILTEATVYRVGAVLISVQMHGYILKFKTHTTPYISWRDNRAKNIALSDFRYKWPQLGTGPKANLPLISLHTYENIGEEEIHFFTLGSYIAWYLTHQNISHITDCAASGFYHVTTLKKGVPDFPNIIIPVAVKQIKPIGTWNQVDVYPPIGDHQLSFFGSYVGDDEYLLNISTATQISTLSKNLSTVYECRPYFDNNRLCTVSGLIGGNVIAQNVDGDISAALIKNYKDALTCLPHKKKLKVSGGAVQHFPGLIKLVCEKIQIEYKTVNHISAFAGFERLIQEMIE